MTTIVKISRVIKHHEDVLRIERIEPENYSRSTFVLPIDGSVEIEIFGKNVSQLIEQKIPKKPSRVITYYGKITGVCRQCRQDVFPSWNACPYCFHRIDWTSCDWDEIYENAKDKEVHVIRYEEGQAE